MTLTVPQTARGDLQPHITIKYRNHKSCSAGKGTSDPADKHSQKTVSVKVLPKTVKKTR